MMRASPYMSYLDIHAQVDEIPPDWSRPIGISHHIYRCLQRVAGHVLPKLRGIFEYEMRKGGLSTGLGG